MAWIKIFVITAGVAMGTVFFSLQHGQGERTREIAWLREANARMRSAIIKREPVRALRDDAARGNSTEEWVRSPAKTSAPFVGAGPTSAARAKLWPVRAYRNAGQATPIAALQTMAWACDQGDVETMAKLFIIDQEARAHADAIYAAILAEKRVEWRSTEEMAAAIIVHNGMEAPYPGAAVLVLAKIEPITEGRVTLVLPGASVSGVVFQQTPEGWKYVVSAAVVQDYIARRLTPKAKR